MKFLTKCRWLVVLRNDKVFVTEDEIQPAELSLRLSKRGVTWHEVRLVLKLPPDEPQRI